MADELSLEAARSLLAEEDILPMSVSPTTETQESVAVTSAMEQSLEELAFDQNPDYTLNDEAVGLGVDIVEIDRMERILKRHPGFAAQVFSEEEQAYCDKKNHPATHYALRFAAKEAVVKALGTGFAEGIWVRDIEVAKDKNGRPMAVLRGAAQKAAQRRGVLDLSISLSYTHSHAVACAMAITEGALKATEKRKDPKEELARQFKETRRILDEL